jgi:CDP-diacylglycerol--glycerol-3-phosphate 3-phosphatidyltransferase
MPAADIVAFHPWLAAGFFLYLALSTAASLRGFFRRLPPGPLARERFGWWLRDMLSPFERALVRRGTSPLVLSYGQIATGALAAVAYAQGWVLLGGWLVLESGVLDLLDGGVARSTHRASSRGAFTDSVVDRYVEFLTFAGLAVYFASSWALWVVALGFFGSVMVSYVRARAEALGVQCGVGIMQRGERYLLLGGGSLLSTTVNHLLHTDSHVVLLACLVALATLANLTALHRIRYVLGSLGRA